MLTRTRWEFTLTERRGIGGGDADGRAIDRSIDRKMSIRCDAGARGVARRRSSVSSVDAWRRRWMLRQQSANVDADARIRSARVTVKTRSKENWDTDASSADVVLFAYDAMVDATVEMTRISHAVASARWPDHVPGDAASYVEAMRTMRRCIDESTSCEGAVMIRVIADEAIIGGRTTSGGRPGPVFSAEQRFERRTRPLTVDEIISSWREIKLMSVLKWGEDVESSVGWDGRKMMPAGLQTAVDTEREDASTQIPGEQTVYEDLKPLIHSALERGSRIFVIASRGRSVASCEDVLRAAGFRVAETAEGFGVSVVSSDGFPSRGLAAANLIASTARPGERWHIIDGDVDELERFIDADFGDEYASLTQGVEITLRHAAYAYSDPAATQRANLHPRIQSLTNDSARNLAINFLGDYAHLMGR